MSSRERGGQAKDVFATFHRQHAAGRMFRVKTACLAYQATLPLQSDTFNEGGCIYTASLGVRRGNIQNFTHTRTLPVPFFSIIQIVANT